VARRSDAGDGGTHRPTRTTRAPRATHRSTRAELEAAIPAPGRAGLGGLLRGPGSVLGGLSGIDGASRSLDRLSRSAERGADFLERLEQEVGWDRAVDFIERMETLVALIEGRGVFADRMRHLVHAVEGIHHSMEEIEAMVADLHEHLMPPRPPRRTTAVKPRR